MNEEPRAPRTGAKAGVVIVVLWGLVLAQAVASGLGVRAGEFTQGMPVWFGSVAVLLPLAGFALGGLRAKRSPFLGVRLERRIDARAGHGATAEFLRRWRPLLMFAAACAAQGAILGVRLARDGTATHEWWAVGFLGSSATGLAAYHATAKRRGVPGF